MAASRMGVVIVMMALAAESAHADGIEDARAHYRRGLAAFALSEYAEAAREYEVAFKAEPDPALLYNAAQAHRLGGNLRRALDLYQSYLRLFGARVRNRAEVERRIVELKAQLAVPPPQPTVATPSALALSTPPARATPAPEPAPREPTPTVTPTASAVTMPPPAEAPRRPRSRAWVWGTVAGAVVVVGLAVGLGVGLGLPPRDPVPSMGQVSF